MIDILFIVTMNQKFLKLSKGFGITNREEGLNGSFRSVEMMKLSVHFQGYVQRDLLEEQALYNISCN